MKKTISIIALLSIIVIIFEAHPAVDYRRISVLDEIYMGRDCDCNCILKSRPWYSRFNYWLWYFVIVVPVLVFSVEPDDSRWKRAFRSFSCILLSYVLVNLSVNLMWDIRNGPFVVIADFPWQKTWDIPDCANVADGGSIVFALLFGWIYGVIYTGWWDIIWYRYHSRSGRLIGPGFKRDIVSKITVFTSVIITVAVVVYIIVGTGVSLFLFRE